MRSLELRGKDQQENATNNLIVENDEALKIVSVIRRPSGRIVKE
jgi:hypothetical protein